MAAAVTSWARGASFATVLDVAAHDVGELAPGDFVRTVKEVADLVGQVAVVSPGPRNGRCGRCGPARAAARGGGRRGTRPIRTPRHKAVLR